MTEYVYDSDTKLLTETRVGCLDDGITNKTDVAPVGTLSKYQAFFWNGTGWDIKSCYLGELVKNSSGEIVICPEIDLPEGYSAI